MSKEVVKTVTVKENEYVVLEPFGEICLFRLATEDVKEMKDKGYSDYLEGSSVGDWCIEEGGVYCGKEYFQNKSQPDNSYNLLVELLDKVKNTVFYGTVEVSICLQ